jgi:ammonia channel protein AmtB
LLFFVALYSHPYFFKKTGVIGALIYLGFSRLLLKWQIDDPLDCGPVHLGAGAWSVSDWFFIFFIF